MIVLNNMASRGRGGLRLNVPGQGAAPDNLEQAAANDNNVIIPTFTRREEKEVIQIPTFTGNNFSIWSNTMEVYLQYKGLWCQLRGNPAQTKNPKT
jgi:hypothetical protein